MFPAPDTQERVPDSDLRARVDKLEMITEALWRLLRQQADLPESALFQAVCDIDLEDGTLDGRKRGSRHTECGRCGRRNSRRHHRCLYCSFPLITKPFE